MIESQPESHAEQTDASKLGAGDGDVERSSDRYPPDEPLAVDDPSILADGSIGQDDVRSRSKRERPEVGETASTAGGRGHDLIDPSADPDRLDDTAQMVAEESDDTAGAAEVRAVHIVPEDGDPG